MTEIEYFKVLGNKFVQAHILWLFKILSIHQTRKNISYGRGNPLLHLRYDVISDKYELYSNNRTEIKNLDIQRHDKYVSLLFEFFNILENYQLAWYNTISRSYLTYKKPWTLSEILNNVDTIDEYILSLPIDKHTKSIYKNLDEFNFIKNLWRKKWKNNYTLNLLYNDMGSLLNISLRIHILNKIDASLEAYRSNIFTNISNEVEIQNITGFYGVRYNLLQLFDYTFQTNFPEDWNKIEFIEKISENKINKDKYPIQALEIVINEGTSREPIQAMIFETFQNAMDVVRVNNGKTSDIKINVITDGNDVTYQISDPVGLDSKALLSLSIPFLSTKGQSQITTGEIGSGFFNIYRLAKKVTIESRSDFIIDKPVYRDGRIVDIKRYHIPNVESFEGTRITVELMSMNKEDKIYQLTEVMNNCANILPLSNSNFTLNDHQVKINKTEIYRDKYYVGYTTQDQYESYVLTKGIPFDRLANFFDENYTDDVISLMSNGLVIDLQNQSYTPVQSRTSLSMTSEQTNVFKKFLGDFTYISILEKQLKNTEYDYIPNYNSMSSFAQTYIFYTPLTTIPEKLNLQDFLLYHIYEGESNHIVFYVTINYLSNCIIFNHGINDRS